MMVMRRKCEKSIGEGGLDKLRLMSPEVIASYWRLDQFVLSDLKE